MLPDPGGDRVVELTQEARPRPLEPLVADAGLGDRAPDAETVRTVYDNQTRSMLETDQKLAGIDSNNPDLKPNADGSYTVWFGPRAPEGHESNWVQTMPGKGWNTLLRLYGPLEPWFDGSWKPGDFELVE